VGSGLLLRDSRVCSAVETRGSNARRAERVPQQAGEVVVVTRVCLFDFEVREKKKKKNL